MARYGPSWAVKQPLVKNDSYFLSFYTLSIVLKYHSLFVNACPYSSKSLLFIDQPLARRLVLFSCLDLVLDWLYRTTNAPVNVNPDPPTPGYVGLWWGFDSSGFTLTGA